MPESTQQFRINFVARALPRSRSIHLKWTKKNERRLNVDHRIFIEINEVDQFGGERRRQDLEPRFQSIGPHNYKWDIGRGWRHRIDPDQKYNVKIYLKTLSGENLGVYELRNCRCYISEEQFQNLRLKAEKFCYRQCGGLGRMRKFTHFYRSDRIPDSEHKRRGRIVLTAKHKLATQGHLVPGVERLPGIFFFARDCEPNLNPFGWRYMRIPIKCLINDPTLFNFYFMDIKCYNGRSHYITIAVTRRGTNEEKYCNKRLGPPLNKWNNPFLRVKYNGRIGEYEYFVPGTKIGKFSNCFMEIFFVRDGQIHFELNKVVFCRRNQSGNRKIPRANCTQCCHLTPPTYFGQYIRPPPIQWPSNSFFNASSYPCTPEPQ